MWLSAWIQTNLPNRWRSGTGSFRQTRTWAGIGLTTYTQIQGFCWWRWVSIASRCYLHYKTSIYVSYFKWCSACNIIYWERDIFFYYLTTHSTHFIYGYMASDIWLRTILIVRKENRCRHIGYSYRLTARVLLYAPSHRQDNTYHGLCYTSCGALAGTRNSSMGPPHEGSIRRPIAPWANALPLSYVPLPLMKVSEYCMAMLPAL